MITHTVDRWDGAEAARRIELHVGRDLQFIRINGTVVGGLVGLVIHAVAWCCEPADSPIRDESIRLGQFLKLANLVDSVSDALPVDDDAAHVVERRTRDPSQPPLRARRHRGGRRAVAVAGTGSGRPSSGPRVERLQRLERHSQRQTAFGHVGQRRAEHGGLGDRRFVAGRWRTPRAGRRCPAPMR